MSPREAETSKCFSSLCRSHLPQHAGSAAAEAPGRGPCRGGGGPGEKVGAGAIGLLWAHCSAEGLRRKPATESGMLTSRQDLQVLGPWSHWLGVGVRGEKWGWQVPGIGHTWGPVFVPKCLETPGSHRFLRVNCFLWIDCLIDCEVGLGPRAGVSAPAPFPAAASLAWVAHR